MEYHKCAQNDSLRNIVAYQAAAQADGNSTCTNDCDLAEEVGICTEVSTLDIH